MLIALIGRDREGAQTLRAENRAAHLAYLESTGVVEQAGPLLDDQGEMIGSLVILDVPDMAAARAWAAADPYARAGLFRDVQFLPWKRVVH